MKILKLSGWEVNPTPVITGQFYKLPNDNYPFLVVIKDIYHTFVEKTDIFETLHSATGNVIAVSYVVPITVKRPYAWRTTVSVPAIYFSEKSDLIMFKLVYSEIISSLYGDDEVGISTINIDIDELKARLAAKEKFR
jgi:hypothetical protein